MSRTGLSLEKLIALLEKDNRTSMGNMGVAGMVKRPTGRGGGTGSGELPPYLEYSGPRGDEYDDVLEPRVKTPTAEEGLKAKHQKLVGRPTRRLNYTFSGPGVDNITPPGVNPAEFDDLPNVVYPEKAPSRGQAIRQLMSSAAGRIPVPSLGAALGGLGAGAATFLAPNPMQTDAEQNMESQFYKGNPGGVEAEITNAIDEMSEVDMSPTPDPNDPNEPGLLARPPGDERALAKQLLRRKFQTYQNALSEFDDVLK